MLDPFLINDCLIEPSRNTVTTEGHTVDIQPKAMAVLLVLKANRGQVVSHDQMMDEVWSNTIVNPNTVQRCITQLRKSLGDDGKQQRIIQTHAKQGYCLIGEINQPIELSSPILKKQKNYKVIYTISFISLIALLFLYKDKDQQNLIKKWSFINPKPITASDDIEHFGSYSPDGEFILFQRKTDISSCGAMLWAKNTKTGNETQLLKTSENLGSVSWSNDGNQIAYTSQTHCLEPKPDQNKCWKLNTLDFSMALKGEAIPTIQLGCYDQRVAHARWLTDNSIAMLLSHENSWQLASYNLITKHFDKIYSSIGKFIYSYDYDAKSKSFVVISKSDKNQHVIERVGLTGEVISYAVIQINDSQTNKEYFNSVLHPSGDYIITYTSSGIRFIDFEGKMTEPRYDNLVDLLSPRFHPSGNKVVATQMRFDTDVGVMNRIDKDDAQPSLSIISRSNAPEYSGKFQPNGHVIAFISMRTGKKQLWLNENDSERQITHAENGLLTFSFLWAPDGKNIALVENGELIIYGLSSNSQSVSLSHKVDRVTQWLDKGNIIYIANNQLYQTNLSGESELIMEGNFLKSAYVLTNGNIFYIDDGKAMVHGVDTNREITELSKLILSKEFVVKNNNVFGININNQFWQFDFTTEMLTMGYKLDYNGVKLTDVKNDRILFSYDVEVQMELIEYDVIMNL
jgi:DNA-binding winged helix-turn-helix (wHTH) protein